MVRRDVVGSAVVEIESVVAPAVAETPLPPVETEADVEETEAVEAADEDAFETTPVEVETVGPVAVLLGTTEAEVALAVEALETTVEVVETPALVETVEALETTVEVVETPAEVA